MRDYSVTIDLQSFFKIKEVKLRRIKRSKSHPQVDSSIPPHLATSSPTKARANTNFTNQRIKSKTPMTFSQKLYQSDDFTFTVEELAVQFEQSFADQSSLEKVKNLLERILELAD